MPEISREQLLAKMIVSGKNTKPSVSVVIVNYNVKDFLLQALRSVEAATVRLDAEIIVVDNNSSDDSTAFLIPLFPLVNFIELSENLGFGRANNIGIELARGEYTLLLNPDTIIAEDTVEVMKDYLDNRPEAGIAGCKVINPDGTFQVACRRGFPTPWASFCKLFGLQSLFPHSPLFARYNQTFRNEDETYDVDALIGAFMFCRTRVLRDIGGFDSDFFMYGEDIDLCYRVQAAGWKVVYYPATTVVHFKGESARRSSMNEVRVFYEAMAIFARKHYGKSRLLLALLRTGIEVRAAWAYIEKRFRATITIVADAIIIESSLLIATKIRFDKFLYYPAEASPTVFTLPLAIMLCSIAAAGGYSKKKMLFRSFLMGVLIAFFILSSLTNFFKNYAYSRGILLMLAAFSVTGGFVLRLLWSLYDKTAGRESDKRIIIVGTSPAAEAIANALRAAETRNADIVGIVIAKYEENASTFAGLPIIGRIEYLSKILSDYAIQEVIIAESSLAKYEIMQLAESSATVKFHVAQEYEDVIIARIVNDIVGIESSIPQVNLQQVRYRMVKRISDILISSFVLTIGAPMVIMFANNPKFAFKQLFNVLLSRCSVVGYYDVEGCKPIVGKPGITGLAHIVRPDTLTVQAIIRLNDYYAEHYTPALDADIIIKFLFRRNKNGTTHTRF